MMNITSLNQVRFIGIGRVNYGEFAAALLAVCVWFVLSTITTIDRLFYMNDSSIIKQCTENKIVVVKDSIIQCKVLDKKVLSGSEQMIMNLKEDYG